MRLRFWRKNHPLPAPPVITPRPEPKNLDCRYCGRIHADPEEHLTSPEHRLAQAKALAPGDEPDEESIGTV